MKKSALASLLLLSSIALSSSNAIASNIQNSKLLKTNKYSKDAFSDVYSGISFQYFDKEDRVTIVKSFLKAIEVNYAPLALKEKRLGINFKKIKSDAIELENSIEDVLATNDQRKDEVFKKVLSVKQAKLNMDFLDRIALLVSKFQDTHFGVNEIVSRPSVFNGLKFYRVDGKVLVTSIDKKIVNYVDSVSLTNLHKIAIGSELVSIDGVAVEDRVNELKKYISASSDGYADLMAVESLTSRNFNYPTKPYSILKFADGSVQKIPYFIRTGKIGPAREDAYTYLESVGIQNDLTVKNIVYNSTKESWEYSKTNTTQGYGYSRFGRNLKVGQKYTSKDGGDVINAGYHFNNGKAYSILQIKTFETDQLLDETGKELSFEYAVADIVNDAKANNMPMIIDLRYNNGGIATHAPTLLGLVTESLKSYSDGSAALRITPHTRQLRGLQQFTFIKGEDQTNGVTMDDLRELLDEAIYNRSQYTRAFADGPAITANPLVGGFENEIVVLVTPECISTCDVAVSLFKHSKRAQIIGTHSNGTGAGYNSRGMQNTSFTDPYKVISTTIPNELFGFPIDEPNKLIGDIGSAEKLCSENVPTEADIKYMTTREDLFRENIGWLNISVKAIEFNIQSKTADKSTSKKREIVDSLKE